MRSEKIFISHSSKDLELVERFNQLLWGGIGLQHDDIFCTSIAGSDLYVGDNAPLKIREAVLQCPVSILLISENYKQSEICLNEMGAAWATPNRRLAIAIDPCSYGHIGWINLTDHAIRINDARGLDTLRSTIIEALGLNQDSKAAAKWNLCKDIFLKDIERLLPIKSKDRLVDVKDFEELKAQHEGARELLIEMQLDIRKLQEKYEKVSALKDAEAVEEIEEEYDDSSVEVNFHRLIQNVVKSLPGRSSKTSIVDRVILSKYYGLPRPEVDGYTEEIDSAIRKKLLDGHDDLEPLPKAIANGLSDALQELGAFFDDDIENENIDFFKSNYPDIEPDPADEDFWDKFYF